MTSEGERESAAAEIQLAEEELRAAENLLDQGLARFGGTWADEPASSPAGAEAGRFRLRGRFGSGMGR